MYNYSVTKEDFSKKFANQSNQHKINEKLLIKLLGTQSPSKNDDGKSDSSESSELRN